jgi:hypothetical protein
MHMTAHRALTASGDPTPVWSQEVAASPSVYSSLDLSDTNGVRLVAPPGKSSAANPAAIKWQQQLLNHVHESNKGGVHVITLIHQAARVGHNPL